VLLSILAACGDDDQDKAPGQSPRPACMLARQVDTSTGIPSDGVVTYDYRLETSYSYDDAGNPVDETSDYTYSYSDGRKATSHIAFTHTYDNDGYRTRTVGQFRSTDAGGQTSFGTTDNAFTYENGRLVKETVATTGGSDLNYTVQYQYNDAGQLVKRLEGYGNSVMEIEYAGNIVGKVTQTDANGNETSPLVQYNGAGLLVKSIVTSGGYTDERRYTYTGEGLISRYELFENSVPSGARMYEYDNKEHPAAYVNAKPKGHPDVPATQAPFRYKHNVLKLTDLAPAADGGWQANQVTTTDLVYNDKGFPTQATSRKQDGNGKELSTSKTTYEYTNCQ
jgi:hypothetical protein